MAELISDTPEGGVTTKLEDMTEGQLVILILGGSQEAIDELVHRKRDERGRQ